MVLLDGGTPLYFAVRGRKRWSSPARSAKLLAKKMRGSEARTRPGKLGIRMAPGFQKIFYLTINALIVLILTSIPYSLAHEAEDLGDPSLPSLVVCIAACPARADASRPLMPVARIRNAQEREVTAHVVLPPEAYCRTAAGLYAFEISTCSQRVVCR